MKTREEIKSMNHEELYEYLQQDRYLTEEEFIAVKNNKLVDNCTFWTRHGSIREYTVEILKPNLNIYADVDIEVKDSE